jgi:hypothetical protein
MEFGRRWHDSLGAKIQRAIIRIGIVWGAVLLVAGVMGGFPVIAGGWFGKIAGFVINLIPGGNISAGLSRRINSGQWTKVRGPIAKGRKT